MRETHVGDGSLAARVDRWLDAWHGRRGFEGVVLVARGDELTFVGGRGFANPVTGATNDASTRFDLGSIAKAYLAVTVLRLVERGVLDLEHPIATHIDELASTAAGGSTLRQLLAHTSGLIDNAHIPDYFARARSGRFDRAALIEAVREAPLLFEPGTGFAYSNFGYGLLAIAAERATGSSYPVLLTEEVLEPAQLVDTLWNDVQLDLPQRAVGHVRAFDGTVSRQAPVDAVADLGSGDVLATASDLWRFVRAATGGALLSQSTVREMLRNHTPVRSDAGAGADTAQSSLSRYGLGWEIQSATGPDGKMRETQGHGGLSYGFVTMMERDPARDTFFAVLSNVRPSDDVLNNIPPPDIRRMQSDLRRMLWGEDVPLPGRCLARILLARYADVGLDGALAAIEPLRTDESFEFDPNAFMLAAYELSEGAANNDAIRLTEYALRAEPESWLLHEALGDFLAEAGRYVDALESHRSAATMQPDRQYLRDRIRDLSVERD